MRDYFGCSGEGGDDRCNALAVKQRLLILVLLVAGISLLHYLTSTLHHPSHDIYRRLYYIPIVLGGLWFCLGGGILTAVTVSFVYLPHVLLQWDHYPQGHMEQYLELLLYNVIGTLTGFLSWKEHRQTLMAQETAQELERSYETLRRQADQILDIENKLRRSERLSAIGELTAGLAHEIRNPLGAIRGAAEVVQRGMAKDDPRYEFSQILLKEVARLNKVLMDFLQFAQPQDLNEEKESLQDQFHHVRSLLQPAADEAAVELTLQIPKELARKNLPAQIQQVLLNLGLNGVQAMPHGGDLALEALEQENGILLRVVDNGVGIPPELQDRVFNPFFTTRKEGSGLGLAICARIVQGHGGEIGLTSSVDQGTTVTILLPWKLKEGEHERAAHSDH